MDQDPANRKLPQAAWGVIFVIAILVVIAGYRFLSHPEPSASIVDAFSASPGTAASPQQQQAQNRLLESLEAERKAIAKARLLSISQAGEQVEELIGELQAEIAAWSAEIDVLLTNEPGKYLAADSVALQAFHHIYTDDQRASPATPGQLRALLQSYMQPIQEALADSARVYSPSEELENQFLELQTRTKQAIASYREPRQKIQSLVSAATKSGRATTPGQTLGDAIAKVTEEYALQETQAIAAAVEAERKKAQRELAALEAESARLHAQRELDRKKLEEDIRQKEAQRKLALIRAEEESKAAEAKITALRKRAADPAVQAKYKPFLTKGKFTFKGHRHKYYEIPQVPSLKVLRERGILKNRVVFWKTGAAFPWRGSMTGSTPGEYGYDGYGEGNDRPTWNGWPQNDKQWEHVEKLYRDFLDLAPIWVEMGVLRP